MAGMMESINPKLKNKTIRCVDCGMDFVFTDGEQRYFASKKLSVPKRCPGCRRKRRNSIVPENGGGL